MSVNATETAEDPEKVAAIRSSPAVPIKQGSCGKKLALLGGSAAAVVGGIVCLIVALGSTSDDSSAVVEAPAPPGGGSPTPTPTPAVPFADVQVTFGNR